MPDDYFTPQVTEQNEHIQDPRQLQLCRPFYVLIILLAPNVRQKQDAQKWVEREIKVFERMCRKFGEGK